VTFGFNLPDSAAVKVDSSGFVRRCLRDRVLRHSGHRKPDHSDASRHVAHPLPIRSLAGAAAAPVMAGAAELLVGWALVRRPGVHLLLEHAEKPQRRKAPRNPPECRPLTSFIPA